MNYESCQHANMSCAVAILAEVFRALQHILSALLRHPTMPWAQVLTWIHLCDDCVSEQSVHVRHSKYFNMEVKLCDTCYKKMWADAKRESAKASEFRTESAEAQIFDRDGTCISFDSLVNSVANKCIHRERARWQRSALPPQQAEPHNFPMQR